MEHGLCGCSGLLDYISYHIYPVGEELKLLAMEASIAREFLPTQNKAVYI